MPVRATCSPLDILSFWRHPLNFHPLIWAQCPVLFSHSVIHHKHWRKRASQNSHLMSGWNEAMCDKYIAWAQGRGSTNGSCFPVARENSSFWLRLEGNRRPWDLGWVCSVTHTLLWDRTGYFGPPVLRVGLENMAPGLEGREGAWGQRRAWLKGPWRIVRCLRIGNRMTTRNPHFVYAKIWGYWLVHLIYSFFKDFIHSLLERWEEREKGRQRNIN